MLGFSFGGLVILKTIAHSAENIEHVYLAAPAYIVNGNPLKLLFKMFIPMKKYMKSQKPKHVEQFLNLLFTEPDGFAKTFLSKVFTEFEMDFTPVPTISKSEAQQIKTPISLFAAKQDLIFPGEKMLKRAKKIFPTLQQAELLEDSKHVQGKKHNMAIERWVKAS